MLITPVFRAEWCNRTDEASAVASALYVPTPNLGDRRGQSNSVWEYFDLCIEDMRMSRGLGLGLGDIYFKYCVYILIECCEENS